MFNEFQEFINNIPKLNWKHKIMRIDMNRQ